jgi:hypothetical protein
VASLLVATPATADDGARVVDAVRTHYSAIKAVRVSGTYRPIHPGVFAAPDPAAVRPDYSVDGETEEFEHWADPPRLRVFDKRLRNGRVTSESSQEYFDGQVYTSLKPASKQAAVHEDGGGQVRPLTVSPLHGMGVYLPFTFRASFADLLSDSAAITVSPAGTKNDKAVWLIEVSSLPSAVQPKDVTPFIRANTRCRLWVSIDGGVLVWKWAQFFRMQGAGPEFEPPPPPAFPLNEYYLVSAYVNADFQAWRDGSRVIWLPRRIVYGNARVGAEYTLRDLTVNPPAASDTFRPAIPPGYAVQRAGRTAGGTNGVSGGSEGEQIRVSQITREAREMLNSPDQIRASTPATWTWVAAGAFLVLAGVVAGRIVSRRRNVR